MEEGRENKLYRMHKIAERKKETHKMMEFKDWQSENMLWEKRVFGKAHPWESKLPILDKVREAKEKTGKEGPS